MAKKKTKKKKKAKKVKGIKRKKVKKKIVRRKKVVSKKRASKRKPKARGIAFSYKKSHEEKLIARIEHFFAKISVAAFKLKSPLKVGDTLHIKGHSTDFTQAVDSMQIEHETVSSAKKGDDIGIKVKDKAREHDLVFLVKHEEKFKVSKFTPGIQQAMFPKLIEKKLPRPKVIANRSIPMPPGKPAPRPSKPPVSRAKKEGKADPYANTKFFKF
ncbi:MAG: hypothetical protein HQ596_00325 [Candidatus Saganbacteria bacterium]|nr:hypothetical protein [Candidatus Saganbacteria bacterium]